MAGQERREVRLDADRPHARAAAAVRNAEGLVKIHVAHVGAEVARTCEPYKCVEIGAVEIDLAAVRMGDRTDLAAGGFRSVSASGSAAMTAIAFAACNLAIGSAKSWKSPVTPGY